MGQSRAMLRTRDNWCGCECLHYKYFFSYQRDSS